MITQMNHIEIIRQAVMINFVVHVSRNIIQFSENLIKFRAIYSYNVTVIIRILDVQYP